MEKLSWTSFVKMKKYYIVPRRNGTSYIQYNEGRLTEFADLV